MRIFISTDCAGGVWDYTAQLAAGLVSLGHDVRVAVVGRPGAERIGSMPEGVDLVTADYPLEWMPGASERDVEDAGDWLANAARDWRADVAHLNQLAYAAHDFDAPTLVVVHSDVLSWFAEVRGTPAPAEWADYARWVRAGLAAADAVAAPSAYQSRLALRHYGRAADHVVHNGVRAPGEPHRRNRPMVVSAGRAWDEGKGMAVLDGAAGLLKGEAPEVHVLGETVGPHGQRFSPENLRAHGRLPRASVDDWLSRASIYVGASLYEPFGLAPLEAALRGAALVLSDIPSFRELWDGCARFFPPGDQAALAELLDELSPDLPASGEMGLAAREHALERYTADSFTARYAEIYSAVRLHPQHHPTCV